MSVIKKVLLAGVVLTTIAMWGAFALAQDAAPAAPAAPATAPTTAAPPAAGATSFAGQFLWASGSYFGTLQIWFLVLLSIATIALTIHFFLANRRLTIVPIESVGELEGLLGEKKFREAIDAAGADPSIFGQVMHAALSEASNGYGAMERAVEETADLEATKRSRSMVYLDVLGAVGPMIGLFGTVYGMILAFQTIVVAAGKPTPAQLAAGISTALVTTFWGLIVGIPAVAAAALIRNQVESLVLEAMVEAEALIGRFKPGAGKKSSTGETSAEKSDKSDKPAMATPKPKAE